MTLEEAIKHCREVAESNRQLAKGKRGAKGDETDTQDCLQCAEDHEQLVDWLTELQEFKTVRSNDSARIKSLETELKSARDDFIALTNLFNSTTKEVEPKEEEKPKEVTK